MSTALGIASVTHVLKDLLNDGLINEKVASVVGTAINVTSLPPSQVEAGGGANRSQLNIFMYRVTRNTGISNLGYPSKNSRGDTINNPPLALNLHYLLTAFGESELHSEILLGYGMQLLHENPVLPRSLIRKSLSPATADDPLGRLPANLLALSTSELAEQIEQIKITNENINTEEMSRLWTAFQTTYRPCTSYQATVVLIESKKSTRNPLPVLEPIFYTNPFKQPVLDKVTIPKIKVNDIWSNQKITVGKKITITGNELFNKSMAVVIGGEELTPLEEDVTNTKIEIEIPDTLRAGVLGVQVAQYIKMGNPETDRKGVESNLISFVLCPTITAPTPSVEDSTIVDDNVESADIRVDVVPDVRKGQRVVLLLNELVADPGEIPKSYSFILEPDFWGEDETQTDSLEFTIKNVKKTNYLTRIQIDGADSPLEVDAQGIFEKPVLSL